MEHVVHGAHWDDVLRVMHDPLSEDEARAAYERGEPVSIAGGGEPLTPAGPGPLGARESRRPAAWAIDAALARGELRVRFYDDEGVLVVEHTYERQPEGRLLLTEKAEYEYADPTGRTAQWTRVTQLRVTAEGRSRVVARQPLSDGSESIRMVEHQDHDLTNHWEPVPVFGEWSSVLKRER